MFLWVFYNGSKYVYHVIIKKLIVQENLIVQKKTVKNKKIFFNKKEVKRIDEIGKENNHILTIAIYCNLLKFLLKEFKKLNAKMNTIIKNVTRVELNKKIASLVLNTQMLKMI